MTPDVTSAEEIARRTPADRDRFADAVRLASIVAVALGHWLMTLLITHGTNGITTLTSMRLSTWLWQVMPLFFVVGGFSHALALRRRPATATFLRARVNRLLPPALVFLLVWTGVSGLLWVLGVDHGPIATAQDRVTTPLWFLGVYLIVVSLAPLTYRWHLRGGGWVTAGLALLTLGVDLIGGPLTTLNVAVTWLAIHQLGYLYADGTLRRPVVAWAMAVGGLTTVIMVTFVYPVYPVLMVGLPDAPVSNMAPPTFALFAHGVWLTGVACLSRGPLTRLLARPGPWRVVVVGNSMIMTIFCWHLSAAFLTEGLVMLTGAPIPTAGTTAWWLTVPLWWLACLVCLWPLVRLFQRFERVRPSAPAPSTRRTDISAVLGVIITAVGLYTVSQIGVDGLFTGAGETVVGVWLPGALAGAVLVCGMLLLRHGPTSADAGPRQVSADGR